MILLDVNVVLALYATQHQHHELARAWLGDLLDAGGEFGVPTTVWHSYLRLTTNRRVVDPPTSLADAFAFITSVRGQPEHKAIEPGPRHLTVLERVCAEGAVRADLVNDAVLASIAIENGAQLVSFDRDFARFPGLRWSVPALIA